MWVGGVGGEIWLELIGRDTISTHLVTLLTILIKKRHDDLIKTNQRT